jgi:hypothetical protein
MAEAVPEYNIITGRRNHVFPQRSNTMYLSKIDNRQRVTMQERQTNRTDDIDMAQPQRWSEMYTRNMPDLHGVKDIVGAQPSLLHRKLNKPQRSLTNNDIPGTKAKPYTFKTTRCVDPNDPCYKLPTVDARPPSPPRFSRDQINVQDIDGAWPKPHRHFEPRDNITTTDIEGAQAGWKPRHKRRSNENTALRNTLSVNDIVQEGFRTTRVVDPLQPSHRIHGRVHEDGPKQRPKAPPNPCGQDFNLHTEDIPGAYPGWKAPHHIDGSFAKTGRKQFRVINATRDIPGANADSKHNYIVTKRVTNPLQPSYRGLDGYPYDLSPPTTPAHDINRPPLSVQQTTDKNLAQRSASDDMARTSLLQRTNPEALQLTIPKQQQQQQIQQQMDPRDAEIQRLRSELSKFVQNKPPLVPTGTNSGRRGGGSSGSKSALVQAGMNATKTGAAYAKANGGGGQQVDRMVLVSRDGRPRVRTPSQQQMTQKRQETARSNDLNAVSNLPSY